jgi:hypothetical protein
LHKDPKQVDNGNLNPDAQSFKPDQEEATGTGKSNQVGAISAGNAGTANVPTQKVKVHSANGNSIEGLAMVDSGSNKSLIRKEFADKFGLVGETKKMKMYSMLQAVELELKILLSLI